MLVHPKDKRDPLTTTDCVYEIPCANCDQTYIGKTGRRFSTRFNEHKKDTQKLEASKQNFTRQARKESQSEQSKSAVADHAVQNNHVINWQDAKVLCKECNVRSRHIHKFIWIRKRAPNSMNRDEGAHFLSHVYDPLLTSSSSTRTPSTGRRQRVKLDQFWRSTLPSVYETVKRKSIFGFEEWTLFI